MGRGKRGKKSGGKRRDRNGTVPGRKTRRIVTAGSSGKGELAGRLIRPKQRLRKLNANTVVDLIAEDAVEKVKVGALRLLLRVARMPRGQTAEQGRWQKWRRTRRCFVFETAIAELRRAVPDFEISAKWEREGGIYQIFFEFAEYIRSEAEVLHYLCSKREGSALSNAPLCLRFLERALAEHDVALRYLIVECVHLLAECAWSETIKEWAGPRVRSVWAAPKDSFAG